MFPEPELLAALSEAQRTIAHLVVLLGVLLVAGLGYLIYRARRRGGGD